MPTYVGYLCSVLPVVYVAVLLRPSGVWCVCLPSGSVGFFFPNTHTRTPFEQRALHFTRTCALFLLSIYDHFLSQRILMLITALCSQDSALLCDREIDFSFYGTRCRPRSPQSARQSCPCNVCSNGGRVRGVSRGYHHAEARKRTTPPKCVSGRVEARMSDQHSAPRNRVSQFPRAAHALRSLGS